MDFDEILKIDSSHKYKNRHTAEILILSFFIKIENFLSSIFIYRLSYYIRAFLAIFFKYFGAD